MSTSAWLCSRCGVTFQTQFHRARHEREYKSQAMACESPRCLAHRDSDCAMNQHLSTCALLRDDIGAEEFHRRFGNIASVPLAPDAARDNENHGDDVYCGGGGGGGGGGDDDDGSDDEDDDIGAGDAELVYAPLPPDNADTLSLNRADRAAEGPIVVAFDLDDLRNAPVGLNEPLSDPPDVIIDEYADAGDLLSHAVDAAAIAASQPLDFSVLLLARSLTSAASLGLLFSLLDKLRSCDAVAIAQLPKTLSELRRFETLVLTANQKRLADFSILPVASVASLAFPASRCDVAAIARACERENVVLQYRSALSVVSALAHHHAVVPGQLLITGGVGCGRPSLSDTCTGSIWCEALQFLKEAGFDESVVPLLVAQYSDASAPDGFGHVASVHRMAVAVLNVSNAVLNLDSSWDNVAFLPSGAGVDLSALEKAAMFQYCAATVHASLKTMFEEKRLLEVQVTASDGVLHVVRFMPLLCLLLADLEEMPKVTLCYAQHNSSIACFRCAQRPTNKAALIAETTGASAGRLATDKLHSRYAIGSAYSWLPFIDTTQHFCVDFLHCIDLGICADLELCVIDRMSARCLRDLNAYVALFGTVFPGAETQRLHRVGAASNGRHHRSLQMLMMFAIASLEPDSDLTTQDTTIEDDDDDRDSNNDGDDGAVEDAGQAAGSGRRGRRVTRAERDLLVQAWVLLMDLVVALKQNSYSLASARLLDSRALSLCEHLMTHVPRKKVPWAELPKMHQLVNHIGAAVARFGSLCGGKTTKVGEHGNKVFAETIHAKAKSSSDYANVANSEAVFDGIVSDADSDDEDDHQFDDERVDTAQLRLHTPLSSTVAELTTLSKSGVFEWWSFFLGLWISKDAPHQHTILRQYQSMTFVPARTDRLGRCDTIAAAAVWRRSRTGDRYDFVRIELNSGTCIVGQLRVICDAVWTGEAAAAVPKGVVVEVFAEIAAPDVPPSLPSIIAQRFRLFQRTGRFAWIVFSSIATVRLAPLVALLPTKRGLTAHNYRKSSRYLDVDMYAWNAFWFAARHDFVDAFAPNGALKK